MSLAGSNVSVGFKQAPPKPKELSSEEAEIQDAKLETAALKVSILSFFGAFLGLLPLIAPGERSGKIWLWLLCLTIAVLYWLGNLWLAKNVVAMKPFGFIDGTGRMKYREDSYSGNRGFARFLNFVNITLLAISFIKWVA
jgi:hypothetical protein